MSTLTKARNDENFNVKCEIHILQAFKRSFGYYSLFRLIQLIRLKLVPLKNIEIWPSYGRITWQILGPARDFAHCF